MFVVPLREPIPRSHGDSTSAAPRLPAEVRIPDYMETVIGWCSWVVHADGLLCTHDGVPWPENSPLEIPCSSDHVRPAIGCTCGVPLCRDAPLLPHPTPEVTSGLAVMWGAVVVHEHERRYRAEYAYPLALVLGRPDETPPDGYGQAMQRYRVSLVESPRWVGDLGYPLPVPAPKHSQGHG